MFGHIGQNYPDKPGIRMKTLTAKDAKYGFGRLIDLARAEPVAALYEQNKIRHVGSFVELEDQLCAMTSDGYVGGGSPDRTDALAWTLSELMLGVPAAPAPFFGSYGRSDVRPMSAGRIFASQPPEYWARMGIFHPSDKAKWVAAGVWKEPSEEKEE